MNPGSTFTPTLRQIRAFVAVYQLRKLTAAAEQLHVTQSAVSVLLRELEEGLGCRLFDRTTRALQPTPAAEEALVLAQRILRDLELLGTGLRELSQVRRGRVRVAVTPTLAAIILPAVVTRFLHAHPEIRLTIDDCAPEQFVGRVLREDVDFGVGAPEGAAIDVDVETLVRDQLALVCSPDHPLAQRRSLRWRDLSGVPVVTVRPGYGIRPLIDAAAAQAGVRLDVANEVSFLSTALWMTDCGHGAAIMPSAYARTPAYARLVVHKLHAPVVSRDISLVTKRGRSLSPAAQALVDVMRAELSVS
jgi:DNA-binding transcriptional LysR family regulator